MLTSQEVSDAICKQAWKDSSLAPLGCGLLTSRGASGRRPLPATLLSPGTVSLREASHCLFTQKVVGVRAGLPLSAFLVLKTIQAELM